MERGSIVFFPKVYGAVGLLLDKYGVVYVDTQPGNPFRGYVFEQFIKDLAELVDEVALEERAA
jgi:hypothetical protein